MACQSHHEEEIKVSFHPAAKGKRNNNTKEWNSKLCWHELDCELEFQLVLGTALPVSARAGSGLALNDVIPLQTLVGMPLQLACAPSSTVEHPGLPSVL